MSSRKSQGVTFVDFKPSKGSLNYGISNPSEYAESRKVGPPKLYSSIPVNLKPSYRLIPKDSIEFGNIANSNKELSPAASSILLSPCQFHNSGCKELVHRGTRSEQMHSECCDYRPIRCIMHTTCDQLVPYHDYIFHLTKHFLLPNYTSDLTSILMLRCRDFEGPTFFSPKWISTNGHQFFLMLKRREDGIWVSWVWMFGTEPEAKTFQAKISYFRGKRFITGTTHVHSIRKPESVIEAKKNCVMFTDQTMQAVSGIGASLVSDIYVNLQILVRCADSPPRPPQKIQIPEPEEIPADPAPEPVPDPDLESEPGIQAILEQSIQTATLATFNAFFDKLKTAMMIAGINLDSNAPEASQSLTFVPQTETLEELIDQTLVSAPVLISEPELASEEVTYVDAASCEITNSDTKTVETFSADTSTVESANADATSGEGLHLATEASAESVEAAIWETDPIGSRVDEAAENETLELTSTYMSDLGSTMGDLYDRVTSRLNDLRLHLYDSLENTFGSADDVEAEAIEPLAPDADVPLNTEVPTNNAQLYVNRRFSAMLADFEQTLEVD